ncbi:zinc-binding loop region of homing endonuclease-domain-containing protein, partial [Lipomyces chichibuensis]|uniref:zinc-binding loop region of homing endonuclease-domain-containing protein n=1 Tax=Lipomyces chichibuensis TaxID=1546026 RepID=UPI0033433131
MSNATIDTSTVRDRFACDFPGCKKTYTRNDSLLEHQRLRASRSLMDEGISNATLDNPERVYACTWPGCNKSFVRNKEHRLHLESHWKWSFANSVVDATVDESADHPPKKFARERWVAAIDRLVQGYRGNTFGSFIPPAVIAPNGCHLPQRSTTEAGYIKIQPVAVFTGHADKDEPNKTRVEFQLASRVVCYLTKSEDDVYNLLYRGYEASHLCHQPKCINPDHLVVETNRANISRRICSVKADVKISVDGRDYILKAGECPHSPQCVIRQETRAAVELRAS